eukprot:364708-Chlamydomonas_euryale.AAC.9
MKPMQHPAPLTSVNALTARATVSRSALSSSICVPNKAKLVGGSIEPDGGVAESVMSAKQTRSTWKLAAVLWVDLLVRPVTLGRRSCRPRTPRA